MEVPGNLEHIAEIIMSAPGWTRVGITAPDPRSRERAINAFAAFISERLEEPRRISNPGQIPLPL